MFYSIDTSALIDWWESYPPNTFPQLRLRLEELVGHGRLFASRSVKDEILDSGDDDTLAKWCNSLNEFYIEDSFQVQQYVKMLMKCYQHPKKNKGIAKADPFVIGLAASSIIKGTVVSSERLSNGSIQSNPNIPLVCKEQDVNHISFLDLIKNERWIFN